MVSYSYSIVEYEFNGLCKLAQPKKNVCVNKDIERNEKKNVQAEAEEKEKSRQDKNGLTVFGFV